MVAKPFKRMVVGSIPACDHLFLCFLSFCLFFRATNSIIWAPAGPNAKFNLTKCLGIIKMLNLVPVNNSNLKVCYCNVLGLTLKPVSSSSHIHSPYCLILQPIFHSVLAVV